MNWPEPSRVRGLSGWLIIATYELAAPAKERIRLEIEAHYAEAVQCHLTNGSTEADAEAAALAELGDARVAAKRFRRQHLTEKDAMHVEKLLRYARSNYVFLFYYAVAGLLLWFSRDQEFDSCRTFLTALILALVAVQTVNSFVAKRSGSKLDLRLFMSLQVLYWLIWVSMLATMCGFKITTLPFACVQPLIFAPYLRVWFKLCKFKNTRQEMPLPPRDAFSAWLR